MVLNWSRQVIQCLGSHIKNGGEGGIRTHGTLARSPVFKTGAFDHSATSPIIILLYSFINFYVKNSTKSYYSNKHLSILMKPSSMY